MPRGIAANVTLYFDFKESHYLFMILIYRFNTEAVLHCEQDSKREE
jgi:hypothetical protein